MSSIKLSKESTKTNPISGSRLNYTSAEVYPCNLRRTSSCGSKIDMKFDGVPIGGNHVLSIYDDSINTTLNIDITKRMLDSITAFDFPLTGCVAYVDIYDSCVMNVSIIVM